MMPGPLEPPPGGLAGATTLVPVNPRDATTDALLAVLGPAGEAVRTAWRQGLAHAGLGMVRAVLDELHARASAPMMVPAPTMAEEAPASATRPRVLVVTSAWYDGGLLAVFSAATDSMLVPRSEMSRRAFVEALTGREILACNVAPDERPVAGAWVVGAARAAGVRVIDVSKLGTTAVLFPEVPRIRTPAELRAVLAGPRDRTADRGEVLDAG